MNDTNLMGRYVDMVKHWSWDKNNDIWMLRKHDTKKILIIGNRNQIMNEYDETERTGILKNY